jgi:DNA-binding transcriptional LysR family regulator
MRPGSDSRDVPNWDDLRIFLEVARQGGVSQAAKHLGLDHSTVSRRVAQLELAMGTKLFERTRSGLQLRAPGRLLLQHAEVIESRALAATASISAGHDQPRGTVRIAMMEGIGSLYLSPRLLPLQSAYPLVALELVTSAHPFNLSRREADIFLGIFRPSGRGLWARKIGEFELGLYASPAYLKRHGVPVFVDYIDDLVAIDAVRYLAELVGSPRVVFHSNSIIAQQHAAIAGLGLVMLPLFAASGERRLRRVALGNVSVRRDLWLSVHRDLQDSPRIRVVTKFLSDLVASDQDFLLGGHAT